MEVRRGVFEVHTVLTDITERKRAEEALKIDTVFSFDRHFLTMHFKVFPKIS